MKKKISLIALFLLVLFSLSHLSHGSGFLIYEHGAAAMAMAGAFVAVANNPTAIFHNPAGIAWLEGTQFSLGTTLITSKASVNLANLGQSFDAKSKWFYPSTAYISHKITDRITAGFGFFTPYGLGLEWPNSGNFPLRYIATKDDMKTFFFNPALAFKVSENMSVAVGASYVHSTLSFDLVEAFVLALGPPPTIADVPINLEASGSAWGFNAGALYRDETFSLGFNWRGGIKIDYKEGDLTLDLSKIPGSPLSSIKGKASTSFNLPNILGIGLAFNLTEKLLVAADVHIVIWSSYDKFVVEVEVPGIETIYPQGIEDKTVEEYWEDSVIMRLGCQYALNDKLDLRAGFLYDQTPQPTDTMDPILPDSNRWAITAGFGYKLGKLVINVAYQFEPFEDRTSPNRNVPLLIDPLTGTNLGEGTYSTTAHLIGISIGFSL